MTKKGEEKSPKTRQTKKILQKRNNKQQKNDREINKKMKNKNSHTQDM